MHSRDRLFLLALMCLPAAVSAAGAIDLHLYWDDRCKECHGHAADFARNTLRVDRGRLIGTHHRDDLDLFLRQHYLAEDLVAPVTKMLMAQVESTPVFQKRCAGCHGSAADFARESLVLKDGALTGKANDKRVADTLRAHGGLPVADVPAMTATLERVLEEVGGK